MQEVTLQKEYIKQGFWKSFIGFKEFKKINWLTFGIGWFFLSLLLLIIFLPYDLKTGTPYHIRELSKKNGGTGDVILGVYKIFGRRADVLFFSSLVNIAFVIALFLVSFNKSQVTKNFYVVTIGLLVIASVMYWSILSFIVSWDTLRSYLTAFYLHAITLIFGIFTLYLMRKEITNYNTRWNLITVAANGTYYIFMIVLFFSTIDLWQENLAKWKITEYNDAKILGGVTFYPVLNFYQPFLLTNLPTAVVVVFDILITAMVVVVSFYAPILVVKLLKIKYRKIRIRNLFNLNK